MEEAKKREQRAVQERVRLALEVRWHGNQRQMARDLRVSQALVSKIVNGHQGAGKKFLAALACQPSLNADWVLHGTGQPLVAPTRGSLPLATVVLPGPPSQCPGLLSGDRHVVADSLDGEHRYWLRAQPGMAIVNIPDFKTAPSDLLLIESDGRWTKRAELVVGHICAVRSQQDGNTVFDLVFIRRDGDVLIPFPNLASDPGKAPSRNRSTDTSNRRVRRRIRPLPDLESDDTSAPSIPKQTRRDGTSDHVKPFNLADVVGVCVYLVRPFPGVT